MSVGIVSGGSGGGGGHCGPKTAINITPSDNGVWHLVMIKDYRRSEVRFSGEDAKENLYSFMKVLCDCLDE